MNSNPNTPGIKWVVFSDFTQFTNDSRNLLKDNQPFLPTGYPVEQKTESGIIIKQKFERRGPRLTFPEIDAHLDKALKIMMDCLC